jgi:nitroreductase
MSTTLLPLTSNELLSTTCAVRRRLDLTRPVERRLIEECLELALQAPSASNMQPWSFVVVSDRDQRVLIAEQYRRGFAAYVATPYAHLPYDDPERQALQTRILDSARYLAERFEEVPLYVIPCLLFRPENIVDFPAPFLQATLYSSVVQASWSFQLALRARGLGSCWTTLHLVHEEEVADILGIPYGQVQQVGLICVGHVQGTDFRPAPREPLETKVHWEAW